MTPKIDYTREFASFYGDMVAVEGAYGPRPVVPPFLETWLMDAFPYPDGNPAARNIADFRTKKEGKSALAAGVALYMATRQPYAEVVIVASDVNQARDRVYRAVRFAVEHGPLSKYAKVYKDIVEFPNHSTIQAIPADWQGASGGNYYCVIFDELHAWTYEGQRRLFDELIIPPTQPNGTRWMSSYAGWEGESLLLREWWDRALAGQPRPGAGALPIYHNEVASLLAFVDVGESSWRMPWMSEKYISEVKASERPNTFARLWLNEWRSNESQFLPDGAWEACYSPEVKPLSLEEKRQVVLGADASTTRDLTALVGTVYNEKGKFVEVVYCKVWRPQRGILRMGKPTVDLDETIKAEILRLHKLGRVAAVYYDPYQLHSIAVDLEKQHVKMVELPQTQARTEADQSLYDAVISRAIRHYNDPTLNEHIKNAVAIESPRGFRLAKERTSQKIDAAVALSMSHYGSRKHPAEPRRAYSYDGTPGSRDLRNMRPDLEGVPTIVIPLNLSEDGNPNPLGW